MRRAEDGMRSWIASPGEYVMSFNGEPGGLWRRNGMSPEVICGTGFCARGFNRARPYQRTTASDDPRASWIFAGIGRDEEIGNFGSVFGGAAGSEIDSADPREGTPPHALIIAEATDFGADFHWVNQEFCTRIPPSTARTVPMCAATWSSTRHPTAARSSRRAPSPWPDPLPTTVTTTMSVACSPMS